MRHLSIDIETYSDIDLLKSGLHKYVQSPHFEILLFAYSVDFGAVEVVDMANGESVPVEIITALSDPDVIKHAYNAVFEYTCLSKFVPLELNQWRCTMLHGMYCGYPAGLGAIGDALGLSADAKKQKIGKALIKTFCNPRNPTDKDKRTRLRKADEPDKWELFKEYNRQDVVSEMAILKALSAFPVPDEEQQLYELDAEINARGVRIDLDLMQGALICSDIVNDRLIAEAAELTGLDNPQSVAQLKSYLSDEGLDTEKLDKATVAELIHTVDDDKIKRVLEIRKELGKTSVTKYKAMENAVCSDGRVRGLLQFYGANRTGRWAGRLVQVQNLPRNYLQPIDYARELVKSRNIDMMEIMFGSVPDTLSQLIRTAFIPDEGKIFAVADFSAIEARVIAWLAKEEWRQEVFATHGKIYEASASAMFGVPIEKITKGNPEYELRQKGKIAELALGYGGSKGALMSMGALNMGLTEEELPEIVARWRGANPMIQHCWHAVEDAAITAVRDYTITATRGLLFERKGDITHNRDVLTITLPNGRELFYNNPTIEKNRFGMASLSYLGTNQTSKKYELISTFGGKLVENIVQAISRDCLAVALKRLDDAGYKTVFHVHDEVVLEASPDCDIDKICDIMCQPIDWAEELILKAAGFVTEFYCKD